MKAKTEIEDLKSVKLKLDIDDLKSRANEYQSLKDGELNALFSEIEEAKENVYKVYCELTKIHSAVKFEAAKRDRRGNMGKLMEFFNEYTYFKLYKVLYGETIFLKRTRLAEYFTNASYESASITGVAVRLGSINEENVRFTYEDIEKGHIKAISEKEWVEKLKKTLKKLTV